MDKRNDDSMDVCPGGVLDVAAGYYLPFQAGLCYGEMVVDGLLPVPSEFIIDVIVGQRRQYARLLDVDRLHKL